MPTTNNANVVFGPVLSRRFGKSLGVDLSPKTKQCNFDCVYCELVKAKPLDTMQDVLPKEIIIDSIQKALMHSSNFDVLTFTANGEPTLYPYLYEVISAIKPLLPSHIKTLILSNGSRFFEQQKALLLFDIVKFSLDGAVYSAYKKTDRPSTNLDLSRILESIMEFSRIFKGELVAEVLLVAGHNDTQENLERIAQFLREAKVARVDLGTIDRPSAYAVKPVDEERLLWARGFFGGLCVNLPKRKKLDSSELEAKSYTRDELLKLIATRPIEVSEAEVLLSDSTRKLLYELIQAESICIKESANMRFYTARKNDV